MTLTYPVIATGPASAGDLDGAVQLALKALVVCLELLDAFLGVSDLLVEVLQVPPARCGTRRVVGEGFKAPPQPVVGGAAAHAHGPGDVFDSAGVVVDERQHPTEAPICGSEGCHITKSGVRGDHESPRLVAGFQEFATARGLIYPLRVR